MNKHNSQQSVAAHNLPSKLVNMHAKGGGGSHLDYSSGLSVLQSSQIQQNGKFENQKNFGEEASSQMNLNSVSQLNLLASNQSDDLDCMEQIHGKQQRNDSNEPVNNKRQRTQDSSNQNTQQLDSVEDFLLDEDDVAALQSDMQLEDSLIDKDSQSQFALNIQNSQSLLMRLQNERQLNDYSEYEENEKSLRGNKKCQPLGFINSQSDASGMSFSGSGGESQVFINLECESQPEISSGMIDSSHTLSQRDTKETKDFDSDVTKDLGVSQAQKVGKNCKPKQNQAIKSSQNQTETKTQKSKSKIKKNQAQDESMSDASFSQTQLIQQQPINSRASKIKQKDLNDLEEEKVSQSQLINNDINSKQIQAHKNLNDFKKSNSSCIDSQLPRQNLLKMSSDSQEFKQEILRMRSKFESVIMTENQDEDLWNCDICLSKEDEEDDPLYQCDLCMVVVHPACYRRDLYDEVMQNSDCEDEPWFCARCKHLINEQPPANKLPNCFLCTDLLGSMIDLDSKEWVHQSCVNWHDDIWFNEKDTKYRKFEGKLDYERFSLTCYICNIKQGACIQCDLKSCQKAFHVRCAIKERLIVSTEEMEDLRLGSWDVKIFCGKHTNIGKKKVQKIQLQKFLSTNCNKDVAKLISLDDQESEQDRVTRRQAMIMANQQQQQQRKRKSVINEIDIDKIMEDDFEKVQSPPKNLLLNPTPNIPKYLDSKINIIGIDRNVSGLASISCEVQQQIPKQEDKQQQQRSASNKARRSNNGFVPDFSKCEVIRPGGLAQESTSDIQKKPLAQNPLIKPKQNPSSGNNQITNSTAQASLQAKPLITQNDFLPKQQIQVINPNEQQQQQTSGGASRLSSTGFLSTKPRPLPNPSSNIQSFLGADPRLQVSSNQQADNVVSKPSGFLDVQKSAKNQVKSAELNLESINTENPHKFKINKKLQDILRIPEQRVTYKDFTLALFRFHKQVGNFYDKPTSTFDLSKYPQFRVFWPNHSRIGQDDIKRYLLGLQI
eukprot:403354906